MMQAAFGLQAYQTTLPNMNVVQNLSELNKIVPDDLFVEDRGMFEGQKLPANNRYRRIWQSKNMRSAYR